MAKESRLLRYAIPACVCFHIFAVTLTTLPVQDDETRMNSYERIFSWQRDLFFTTPLGEIVRFYLQVTGTQQQWILFSPDPAIVSRWLTVRARSDSRGESVLFTNYMAADARSETQPVYRDINKFADTMVKRAGNDALHVFSRYWAKVYRDRHGEDAREISVELDRRTIKGNDLEQHVYRYFPAGKHD